jgi:hypothetical protein
MGWGTFSKCVSELNYLYSKHKMISFEEAVLKRERTPNKEAQ